MCRGRSMQRSISTRASPKPATASRWQLLRAAAKSSGLHDQVVRFLETLAVEGRVDAASQLLLPAAADEAGHQPALGQHVDHRQFFRELHRIVPGRQRIAEHDDLAVFGGGGEGRGEDVGAGLHAEWRVVVLIQHDSVDAKLVRQDVVFQVFVIQPAAGDGVEVLVGEHQRGGAEIQAGLCVVGRHRLFGEIHQVHGAVPFFLGGQANPGLFLMATGGSGRSRTLPFFQRTGSTTTTGISRLAALT